MSNRWRPWKAVLATCACASTMGCDTSRATQVELYTLIVALEGTGSGTVRSSPPGIHCGMACDAGYASGTLVILTAEAAVGSVFVEWTGACTGPSTTCQVTMSEARSVTATFNALGLGFGPEQFAVIPAGTFQMGDITGVGSSWELPVHTVYITRPFHLLRTPVTQEQWREVMGSNPSWFSDCGPTCPVENVNWHDVQGFLARLNTLHPGADYRLPTEAEWEYACRAGTMGDYGGMGTLEEMGWFLGNSESRTHPVAQKLPNTWGLYDMHGSVWEWVQDWFSETYYSVSPRNDPPGPETGLWRVLRGGSWIADAHYARCAYRNSNAPTSRYFVNGFRLARAP